MVLGCLEEVVVGAIRVRLGVVDRRFCGTARKLYL
jgi:hypothetical protein